MVDMVLTKEMIEAGAVLVRKLDEGTFQPEAAFWLYNQDDQKWKLVLAEAKLASEGPRQIYKKIQETLSSSERAFDDLSLDDITLAKPDSSIVASLRSAIKTGPGISGIRFTNHVINGNVIDDAYIYRLV